MLANHNKFEEKLRKRFEGAEMTPPPDLWSKIDKQLQYEPPKKKTDYRSFYLGAAAAFFLCLLSAGLYSLLSTENTINPKVSVQNEITEKKTTPNAGEKTTTSYNYKEVETDFRAKKGNELPKTQFVVKNTAKIVPLNESESIIPETKQVEVENVANISIPPIILNENTHNTGNNEVKKGLEVLIEELEGGKELNPTVLAVKKQLNTPEKNFMPEHKSNFAQQLTEIQPIVFNTSLKANGNISNVLNHSLEMPLTAKKHKFSGYINAGVAKVYYDNLNDNARYAWNKLGIGSVRAVNDSANILAVETPTEINDLSAYNVTDMQLLIINYDKYVGGGVEYKLSRFFGLSTGINAHQQRLKKVDLPFDYVQDYQPKIFSTRDNWFKNKNSSFITKHGNDVSNISIETKDLLILEFPCMANFHFPVKRSVITASLGTSYRKLLQFTKSTKQESNSLVPPLTSNVSKAQVINRPSYQAHNATFNVRVEYQYQLSPKNAVFAAANAQWFAAPFYGESISSQRVPKLVGMETGMKF